MNFYRYLFGNGFWSALEGGDMKAAPKAPSWLVWLGSRQAEGLERNPIRPGS